MQIANSLAGYTLGEADILRRAMSKKKMDVLQSEEERFISKCVQNGHSSETSKQIFDLILSFANYGFNRSHSVAYSMIAYKMAYLKYYYPKYFYSSLLTSVIGSCDKLKEYIMEVKNLKISVLKPCINHSDCSFTVFTDGIYYPFSGIHGIGSVICNQIVSKRGDGYSDIFDFLTKVKGLNRNVLESLILAGCFDCFNINRKTYIDNLDAIINYSELIDTLDSQYVLKPELEVKEEYSNYDLIRMEKELFGIYLSNHPVSFYKNDVNHDISLNLISNYFDKIINVVVLVERIKTTRTKNGDDMMFFDGSDEYSMANFILFPKIYQSYSDIKIGDVLSINGKVEKRFDSYQIVVSKIKKLN